MANVPNESKIGNITVNASDKVIKGDFFQLPFYKKSFLEASDYVKFIKSVERLIRTSEGYKKYISYLMGDIGLDHCMIQPNITSELADIEMHHGPILTLFDYCSIVTNYLLKKEEGVNTFKIAKIVLDEHFENNVQVVMLSKTTHQLEHTGKMFIHPDQAWGNINAFIEKYKEGMSPEQIDIFNEYVEMSEKKRTTDSDILKVANKFKSYNKNTYDLEDLQNFIEDIDPRNNSLDF